jgi:WD40 repeat protein
VRIKEDCYSKEHVSILGEFGTGKTWFVLHYAWECLRAYKKAKLEGVARPRFPIVITLRDYSKSLDVENVLAGFFYSKYKISLNASIFDCLNKMGKLLIIFDGFDEMADKVDRQKMINNFWELARVVCPGSKVILTSRTEHFPHDRESRQLLNAELESSTAKLKWESPRFELLELAKFNESQIRRVLTLEAEEKGLSTDIVEKVMVRAELLDLARRPVMTELIIEAMPEIEAGKPVDMSRIYYYAIVRKMDRDIKAERTFTSLADKLYFLCEIAWEMLSTEQMKLNYREFPDRIRQIFPQLVTEAKDLDHWHYDMMGQTILIRNADGDYTPAHRSLLEFLVAYKFAAEAGVLKADFVEAVQDQTHCIDGDAMPQDYTWTGYLQACVAAKCEGKKIAPLRGFVPESSEYLRNTFGREPLDKAVIDLIVPTLVLPNLMEVEGNPLLDVLYFTKKKTEADTGWLGGNAATLLVKQIPVALIGKDLSYTQLANSNLVEAYLQRVDFVGTNLTNSLFQSVLASKVLVIANSKNGRFFATGHDDNKVRIWDAVTGQIIYTYTGHEDWVISVAISPDNSWLVSGSRDKTLKHWDMATGECLHTYTGYQDWVTSVAISPDGSWLVSGHRDKTLKHWNVLTRQLIHIYIGHKGWVTSIAISPDGSWLVSGSRDKTLKHWDVATGECLHTYTGHQDWVTSVAISPDGSWLASGSEDKTLKHWDVLTRQLTHTYLEHQGSIVSIAIAPDGNWLVSGSNDRTLKYWNTATKECFRTYTGHQAWVTSVAISPDGSWLLSGSDDKTLKRWDTATGECLHTYAGYRQVIFRVVAIAPDGSWLLSGSDDKTLKRWDTATGECLHTYAGHQGSITSVEIAPDGSWLLSGSNDKTLKRWDTATGECLHTYAGHQGFVTSVAISPDGSWLLSGSNDETLKRWGTFMGECLYTYIGHQGSVTSIAVSADGSRFVSGSNDETLRHWDTTTGQCLLEHIGRKGFVTSVAIFPDDSWLYSGSRNETLKRWNLAKGKWIDTDYVGHDQFVTSVAISKGGNWLVSGSNDETLKRWDTDYGICLKTYTGHQNPVCSVTVSSDGCYIVSCGGDEIKIWDVETGECIRTISDRPYSGMRIGGAIGLTSGQIESLKALGAVDD